MTGNSCMSFNDLHQLAEGRAFTPSEGERFNRLDQEARNRAVAELARKAKCIRTQMRTGTDGVQYLAFWQDDTLYHVQQTDGVSTYHATHQPRGNRAAGDNHGDFTSFGSKEPDGWHKTTIVEDNAGQIVEVKNSGGGAMTGGFWNWVAGTVTRR